MNRKDSILIILSVICISACDSGPELKLTCPPDMSLVLSSDTVLSSSINFPAPNVDNNCNQGEFTYTIDCPKKIYAGTHIVNYFVSSPCGLQDTCSFTLTAIDYRTRFVGTYTGREICYFGYNYATPISDKPISVEVSLSENPNRLQVNDDEMTIDSTGSSLYPSCCGYRWYGQRFWADSLFVYKNTGSLGYPNECSFRGKKQ